MIRRILTLACGLLLVAAPFGGFARAGADIQSECTKTDKGYRCIHGPVTVGEGDVRISAQVAAPPEEGFVTGARAEIVDAKGRRVSSHMIHLHHAIWKDPTRSPSTCFSTREPIYATGSESIDMDLPEGYGFYWSNRPVDEYYDGPEPEGGFDDSPEWWLTAMLMNMHGDEHEMEVFIRLNLRFTPAPAALTDFDALWWTAVDCGGTFDVDEGGGRNGRVRKSETYRMVDTGRFVWAGAHLHDGGLNLILRNVTQGERLFALRAHYDDDQFPWHLTGTDTFSSARGIEVQKGDLMKVIAVYDSTHEWKDVMGNFRAAVVPVE